MTDKNEKTNESFSAFENWFSIDKQKEEEKYLKNITSEYANELIEKEKIRRKNECNGINCDG